MPSAKEHPCVSECGNSYSKARALAYHQGRCSYILRNRQRIQEIRSSQGRSSQKNSQRVMEVSIMRSTIDFVEELRHFFEQPTPSHQHAIPMDIDASSRARGQASRALSLLADVAQPMDLTNEDSRVAPPQDDATSDNPPLTATGRPRRKYRLPKRFQDILPEPPVSATTPQAQDTAKSQRSGLDESRSSTPIHRVATAVWECFRTITNQFGLWREYPCRPLFDPDGYTTLRDLSNAHPSRSPHSQPDTLPNSSATIQEPTTEKPSYWPFPNPTTQLLMSWLNNGSTSKTYSEADKLVHNCILSPEFCPTDLAGFNAARESRRMDKELSKSDLRNRFTESPVNILVPTGSSTLPPQPFTVPGLLHRNLMAVIRDAFSDPLAHLLHYSPFKLFHHTTQNKSPQNEQVFNEVYSSDAFIEEYKNIQTRGELPLDDPHCKRENVVAALMFSSDATHLTEFGNAKAWPIYMMLGNLSKYIRSEVNSGAMHHLAYIPTLPKSFEDFVSKFHSSWNSQSDQILAHCRRELVHAVWRKLLDDEFLEAYKYGIVIRCIDGVERRVYPRFFTYSADYPEKVLLATIRDKGLFPCPRCLVHRSELRSLGLKKDAQTRSEKFRTYVGDKISAARKAIYDLGLSIRSNAVELLLRPISAVPTSNAFVDRLGPEFNPSTMLTVDLLHEIELGTWKRLFSYLVDLLSVAGAGLVATLDSRFRSVPAFGSGGDGIRAFSSNASEMKKMAGRDFEDLLQCAIPCFEGLLPPALDRQLSTLIYRLAEWHALAKLRMHRERTLELMDNLTRELGSRFRRFQQDSSSVFSAKKKHQEGVKNAGECISYFINVAMIDLPVFVNYRAAVRQIGNKYLHRKALRAIERQERHEARDPLHLSQHHVISHNVVEPINIYEFVRENPADPAKKEFIFKLKDHLLGRSLGRQFDGDMHDEYSDADRNNIRIRNNTIFRHRTARIHYTTYDVRRDHDTINPRNRPFCMVPAPDTRDDPSAHPFWYCAVIGIFHAEVQHTGIRSRDLNWKTVEFLWVRWLGLEPGYSSGRQLAKLPKYGFVPDSDDYAFSFLDPGQVIRGCHLIPAFVEGRTSILMPYSGVTEARPNGDTDDWTNYYVNIFVDRDMYMWYTGLGIGHQAGAAADPESNDGSTFSDDPEDRLEGDFEMHHENPKMDDSVDRDEERHVGEHKVSDENAVPEVFDDTSEETMPEESFGDGLDNESDRSSASCDSMYGDL
ncbi:hypothetical protein NP233_g12048 [Leucocoprinus birnbaumii]|uniref:C2H2-type domain-containing protein n=1 Tax=Leucocoprinus birnbaumii TaxID=56174 RepID=A0AAD5VHS7_9AGAR|nr:hypothetical protein NP233_g12048 [Leucocoprinus birnbaumii]